MSRQCIGLDIGSSAIKLVQLQIGRKSIVLHNFGLEPVAPQSIVDGTIMNHGALVDALRNLGARIHLKGKTMAIALSGNAVITKRVSIPFMEGPALQDQIEWEIRQNIPFAREDVVVDHAILVERNAAGQMELLLAAAKKDVVGSYMQVVRDAGFTPAVVDSAAFAVQNAVEGSVGYLPGETVAIINIGASHSTLCIVSEGLPSFNRELGSGGHTYTRAIQDRLALSYEGAEAYKIGAAGSSTPEVVPQELHKILAQVSEQVAGEFQRSLDFYLNDVPDTRLARIYLAGGSCLVPQLPKAIQNRARIPVEILDPFVAAEVDPSKFDADYLRANAPAAVVAFGLALRSPGDSG